jgi:hypothetical protein
MSCFKSKAVPMFIEMTVGSGTNYDVNFINNIALFQLSHVDKRLEDIHKVLMMLVERTYNPPAIEAPQES